MLHLTIIIETLLCGQQYRSKQMKTLVNTIWHMLPALAPKLDIIMRSCRINNLVKQRNLNKIKQLSLIKTHIYLIERGFNGSIININHQPRITSGSIFDSAHIRDGSISIPIHKNFTNWVFFFIIRGKLSIKTFRVGTNIRGSVSCNY